jgi:DNA-binding transcriptional regulator YhcF (GntR family)
MAIVETLRGRVLRGLQAGTLGPGDRLPSARELVSEFEVDHRLILAAYRELADEGLIEIRERGGVYVSPGSATLVGLPALPVRWFVETLTDAFTHEIPGPELHEWLRRATETLRLRAVVISSTEDQVVGLARELNDDFGLIADGIQGSELADPLSMPTTLRRADLIVTTAAHTDLAARLGSSLKKPVIAIDVRPDLTVGEWSLLLRHPVWAIVATAEFGNLLLRFFENVKGVDNLRILVHGRDDLSIIPDGAPTYVTQRVRQALGDTPMRGRILPAARTISTASAKAIFEFIVSANLGALRAVHVPLEDRSAKRSSNG